MGSGRRRRHLALGEEGLELLDAGDKLVDATCRVVGAHAQELGLSVIQSGAHPQQLALLHVCPRLRHGLQTLSPMLWDS